MDKLKCELCQYLSGEKFPHKHRQTGGKRLREKKTKLASITSAKIFNSLIICCGEVVKLALNLFLT